MGKGDTEPFPACSQAIREGSVRHPMMVFNGRYRWDGTRKDNIDPIAWFPGAYDVKIFHRSNTTEKVRHFKPYVCLYSRTGEGQSISDNPERFAKRICRDFSLAIDQVLWVEDLLLEKERYDVVQFIRTGKVGENLFYRSEKRKALATEITMIQQGLADLVLELKAVQ